MTGTPSRMALASETDVVIVGAGLAGLFTALKLAPMPVTIVTAATIGDGASSTWAQGGIAAAVGEGDTPEAHARDTIEAGAGLVSEDVARIVAEEAPERILDLLGYGVPFDKGLEGKLELSREAAHSRRRIVRVRGDQAGAAIMAALIAAVRRTPSIRILERVEARALVCQGANVIGIRIAPAGTWREASLETIPARAVVLATGGIGHLYATTTNPAEARGGGLAMAAEAGAVIADAEFVQFHPTALDIGSDPAPLATEALRGEGAILVNGRGERFMVGQHADAELAPRDIVARAVHREIAAGRGAYLDARKAIGERFAEKFPAVYEKCREAGIDPTREPIPIRPAAHYHMGGLLTDIRGRTTLDGLWACGEVAATGLHGANRLASNSLIEAVVFGARVAEDIAGLTHVRRHQSIPLPEGRSNGEGRPGASDARALARLRALMSRHVGVVRDHEGLTGALEAIDEIEREHNPGPVVRAMMLVARFVAVAALERKESRGAHFRADYPATDPKCAERSMFTIDQVEAVAGACLGGDAGGAHPPRHEGVS